jgi:hypothetical protein
MKHTHSARWGLAGLALALGLATSAAWAQPQAPAPVERKWVQLTGDGPELRLVTPAARCPEARLDGRPVAMQQRAASDEAFPVTVCQLPVPAGVRRAAIGDWIAPLPAGEPRRILIFGDTGCRLKGAAVQACNDPRQWPFALISRRAAEQKPDLVIHVGDYYYRESPCPAGVAGCAGSPHGDNWTTWDAEFFDPASPLLGVAPWVFVRGNHESCKRGGPGWFRLLDSAPAQKTCPADSAPFELRLGKLNLFVTDSADAEDQAAPQEAVDRYQRQLDALGEGLTRGQGWLLTHRPIWAMVPVAQLGPLGAAEVAINRTLQEAVRGRALGGVQMVVAGHIHHFASYDFGPDRPAQLVAGTGGDIGEPGDSPKLTSSRPTIDGLEAEGFSFERYGYLLLDRDGADWNGVFRDLDDKVLATCRLHERRLSCRKAPKG